MAGLIKQAEGLQKFTMTCGFWRSPKWVGVSLASIGLGSALVSYCYEHTTDGVLPGDSEDLAAALGLKHSQVRAAVKEMLERGLLERNGKQLVIVNYLEHNPSAAEVTEHRANRKVAGAKANHIRWHVERNITDPDCPLCPSAESANDPSTDAKPESESDEHRTPTDDSPRNGEERRGRNGVVEPELVLSSTPPSTGVGNGGGDHVEKFQKLAAQLATEYEDHDCAVALNATWPRLAAGELTSPIMYARKIALRSKVAREAPDVEAVPKRLDIEGELHVYVPGQGWVSDADDSIEVTA